MQGGNLVKTERPGLQSVVSNRADGPDPTDLAIKVPY